MTTPATAPASEDGASADAAPDPEFEAFDAVCRRLAGFDEQIETEWVDGYLTALAASWREIGIGEWRPALCGDAFERAFSDPADVAQALAALGARYAQLRRALDPQALLDEPDTLRLAPYMMVWDDEARERLAEEGTLPDSELALVQTGALWALGFLDAVDDFAADWPDPDERDELAPAYEDMLLALGALVLPPGDEQLVAYMAENWPGSEATRDDLVDAALYSAQDLRVWWIDHGPKLPPRRVAAQPGRNDACPCGSGKKFKKCHGAVV